MTRTYHVGIGGEPESNWTECDDYAHALAECYLQAETMANEQGIDSSDLDEWGEDDPDIGAGVCPSNDDGAYWPNVFIREVA